MSSSDTLAVCALALSALAIIVSVAAVYYTRRQTIAAEASVPQPPPPVDWRLERSTGGGFRLRNIGTKTATGVWIDSSRFNGGQVRAEPNDGIIEAGASIAVWLTQTYGQPSISELPVGWDGHDGLRHIAVPPPDSANKR